MDSLVKQRLVGALILVALAVVFWPIIFVTGESGSDEQLVRVPEAPPMDTTPLPEPDNAGLRSPARAAAQDQIVRDVAASPAMSGEARGSDPASAGSGSQPDEEDAATQAEALAPLEKRDSVVPVPTLDEARDTLTEPAIDEDGLPVAFSLQVATMANRESADRLRDALIEGGYKAYTKRLRRDDRVLYRVLVGPKFQREDLVPVKAAVDEAWRVDSLIIRYVP
ncbi:MAG: SPOR domain-containing protein [Halieaceae bacterium]|nr:SPOR domain-containing protein [Halieaceae bacterium]